MTHDELKQVESDLKALGAHAFACRLAEKHGWTLAAVLGRRRSRALAAVRRELWTVVRDTFGLSLPDTGRLFRVDHTSILYASQVRAWERDGRVGPSPGKVRFARRLAA